MSERYCMPEIPPKSDEKELKPMSEPVDEILQFFAYTHLPPALQAVSGPFCELANGIVRMTPRCAERTAALRKLLEAKDCAVRAAMCRPVPWVDRHSGPIDPLEYKPNVVGPHTDKP